MTSGTVHHGDGALRPAGRPVGWMILVPGYPQWAWRQGERGAVYFGAFAGAFTVGLFAWGSGAGLAMLGLAFLAHVGSAADAIRQGAFPGFGRWVPAVTASVGLGLGCYAPALALASVVAWPDRPSGRDGEGYLINRWAYRASEPSPGDWVWYRTRSGCSLGRLVAGAGRAVEWSGKSLRVDGAPLRWLPSASGGRPIDLAMEVPEGQVLLAPEGEPPGAASSCGLRLVPRGALVGRPWARLYPVWTRRLLS